MYGPSIPNKTMFGWNRSTQFRLKGMSGGIINLMQGKLLMEKSVLSQRTNEANVYWGRV